MSRRGDGRGGRHVRPGRCGQQAQCALLRLGQLLVGQFQRCPHGQGTAFVVVPVVGEQVQAVPGVLQFVGLVGQAPDGLVPQ
ncbi:hypothetical protein ACFCXF_27745 [Streptomyces virginiae]|uniref:hypothetical protein n=1 Tax=Streptomyces virginiae TaxID=1961 RepID=UPI0035D8A18D